MGVRPEKKNLQEARRSRRVLLRAFAMLRGFQGASCQRINAKLRRIDGLFARYCGKLRQNEQRSIHGCLFILGSDVVLMDVAHAEYVDHVDCMNRMSAN